MIKVLILKKQKIDLDSKVSNIHFLPLMSHTIKHRFVTSTLCDINSNSLT